MQVHFASDDATGVDAVEGPPCLGSSEERQFAAPTLRSQPPPGGSWSGPTARGAQDDRSSSNSDAACGSRYFLPHLKHLVGPLEH